MKVQIVTPYHVSHLQRYGVKVCGNVTCVYQALNVALDYFAKFSKLVSHVTGKQNVTTRNLKINLFTVY
jgi:NADH:ubiquinone oxidoreductase subunit E